MSLKNIAGSFAEVDIGPITLLSVLKALMLFLVCLIAIRIIMTVIGKILDKSAPEPALKRFIRTASKIVLWGIAIILVSDILGVNTTSLVAILSVVGLALSLSVQNVLSNIFSGFTIISTKPFTAGDYVELDNVLGTVDEVGLFYTRLKTVDNKLVYVPNAQVTATKIINYTKEGVRRLDLMFKVSYKESPEKVKNAIQEAVNGDKRVMSEPAPFVGVQEYLDTSVSYIMQAWVKSSDYLPIFYKLNESVRKKLTEYGVQMTYSHINVHVIED